VPNNASVTGASEGAPPAVPEAAVEGDTGRQCFFAADRVCIDNGSPCTVDAECCSFRCAAGLCMPAGTCSPPGTPCATRSSCCSGRCEPTEIRDSDAGGGEQTVLTCLNICLADGASCRSALDCCSMGCHQGKCGAPVCGSTGDAGMGGSCRISDDPPPCDGTGSVCNGSGSCCSEVCGLAMDRCQFGPGPCLPVGSLCIEDSDCCRGACSPGNNGVKVCTAPCLADGQSCMIAADCCGGHCNGEQGMCASEAPACKLLASPCAIDSECCSEQCLGGSCGSNCSP
jgi:hypothetical protein